MLGSFGYLAFLNLTKEGNDSLESFVDTLATTHTLQGLYLGTHVDTVSGVCRNISKERQGVIENGLSTKFGTHVPRS